VPATIPFSIAASFVANLKLPLPAASNSSSEFYYLRTPGLLGSKTQGTHTVGDMSGPRSDRSVFAARLNTKLPDDQIAR